MSFSDEWRLQASRSDRPGNSVFFHDTTELFSDEQQRRLAAAVGRYAAIPHEDSLGQLVWGIVFVTAAPQTFTNAYGQLAVVLPPRILVVPDEEVAEDFAHMLNAARQSRRCPAIGMLSRRGMPSRPLDLE